MIITWRDVLSVLALAASGVTLWLRIKDRLDRNRRARRNQKLIEADPVDPLQQADRQDSDRHDDDPDDGQDDDEPARRD